MAQGRVRTATGNNELNSGTSGSGASSQLSSVAWLNLGLRAVMETGIVLGLAYWGYQTGSETLIKIVLAIATPLVGFGFWGAVDFHQAGQAAESLRLVQELLLSWLAALALWNAGQPALGLMMALLSIVYHALIYSTGGRLLKSSLQARASEDDTKRPDAS